ncbi:MAG: DUF6206 family protein, partial [Desulfocucumaceae bacterium]
MDFLNADVELLREFERMLDPRFPERCKIPAKILGYGEISTVFEIHSEEGLAFKRMPVFENRRELEDYQQTYYSYNRALAEDAGLMVPRYGSAHFTDDYGRIIYYIIQEKLPSQWIGSRVIHLLPPEEVNSLLRAVLREIARVF